MITEKDMQSDDVMIKRAIVRIVALIVIGGLFDPLGLSRHAERESNAE
jgi:hypothetical protein